MLYAIIGNDVPNSLEKRMNVRAAHLERVRALQDEGRLILVGPFPSIDSFDPGPAGFTGSLIVAEFESLEAATLWANEDPYATTGVFSEVIVRPFKKVLPE